MKLFVSVVMFLVWMGGSAQRQRVIDSLTLQLEKTTQKSDKISLLLQIAELNHTVNPTKGIQQAEQVLALTPGSGFAVQHIRAHRILGMCHKNKGDFNEAFDALYRSLALAEQANLPEEAAYTKRQLASTYKSRRDKNQALKLYRELIEYYESTQNEFSLSIILIDVGGLFSDHGDLEQAKIHYERALTLEKKRNDPVKIGIIIANLGNIYGAEGNYKKAMSFYNEAMVLAQAQKNDREEAVNYGRMGFEYLNYASETQPIPEAFRLEGTRDTHLRLAIENIEKAAAYFKKTEQVNEYQSFMRALPEAYFLAGRYEEGIKAFKEYYESKENSLQKQRERDLARAELNYEYVRKRDSLRLVQVRKELEFQNELQLNDIRYQLESEQQQAIANQKQQEIQFREKLKRQELETDYQQKQALLKEENQRKMQNLWWASGGGVTLLLLFYFIRSAQFARRKARMEKTFSENLVKSVEEERKRIAEELHDSVGQGLLLVKNALYHKQKEDAHLVDNVIGEVRSISQALHPYQFERLGLIASLENTVEQLQQNFNLFFSFEQEGEQLEAAIPKEKQIHLYRMVQEALNNVIKHARATACRVAVTELPDAIQIEIKDNGVGFEPAKGQQELNSLGMKTLHARATLTRSKLHIDSAPGAGTTITITVPKATTA